MGRIEDNLHIKGRLSADHLTIPDETIADAAVSSTAGIDASKLKHQYLPGYSQPNTTATTVTQAIHVAKGAGTIEGFRAGSIGACAGAATITADLKKNGTTVLSAVIELNSSSTARVVQDATLSGSPTVAAGDLLEVVVTATAGGGTIGTGFYCQAIVREAAE